MPTPTLSIETAPEAALTPEFLETGQADRLFRALVSGIVWDERMKARKTACFGQTYDDSGVDYTVVPMHPVLLPLRSAVEARLGFHPTNCLINYYENGRSSMGFHSDAVHNLAAGTGVAIISLGSERSLSFRSKTDPALLIDYPLPHGSLFYMTQRTQEYWTHAVRKTDTDGTRISLTFRKILSPEELAGRQESHV
ncbi:MAG: alpha-ketoglutarate-dependent dioxygenase AlkB [Verrucomicrobiaceae bacterium]|nr:MAG: alpha-ketoglutarate-dependent dioxygenase AlkB [Verrucomicrobiaceae bacterium]